MEQLDILDIVTNESTAPKDRADFSFLSPGVSPLPKEVSPSYADISRKKHGVSSTPSEDESFEQSKKGRKSKKEIWEEEAERLKTQGSQATI